MAKNYYSTVAALSWVLGHHFYNDKHYTWLAAAFHTHGLSNPKSSNPLKIYQDLYEPWIDRDDADRFIRQLRLDLKAGVIKQEDSGILTTAEATRLKVICDHLDIVFFYPLVYRVDIDRIPGNRRIMAGSALKGSSEYLVQDLDQSEFDILFLDFASDPDFRMLVLDELAAPTITRGHALTTLEGRCR